MPYEFPVDPAGLFKERRAQMILGLPAQDVDNVGAAITNMWADAAGSWCFEWCKLAKRYADANETQLAFSAYGWAKFPTLANQAKRNALQKQLEQYLKIAPTFPAHFERKILRLPHQGVQTTVPVHILTAPNLTKDAPVLLVSGGVDGWKMDFHNIFLGIAMQGLVRVVVFDIAGTGESQVPMTSDGGSEIVSGLIADARASGARKVVHLGISMGGYYSARSGLAGEVDGAIDLGGPVEAAFTRTDPFQHGMADIVGNAMGFDLSPDLAALKAALNPFSLRHLLDQDLNAPMLVLNGADDIHVPQDDTLVFEGRRDTEVYLLCDAGHCAPGRMSEVLPTMYSWLSRVVAA